MGNAVNAGANIVGLIIGLAIIAVLATHPQIISDFFNGVSSATRAAEAG